MHQDATEGLIGRIASLSAPEAIAEFLGANGADRAAEDALLAKLREHALAGVPERYHVNVARKAWEDSGGDYTRFYAAMVSLSEIFKNNTSS